MICVYFTDDTQAMFDDVVQYALGLGIGKRKSEILVLPP